MPTVHDCLSLPAGIRECRDWSWAKRPQACAWGHTAKRQRSTQVCVRELGQVGRLACALPNGRFNFTTAFLCVSTCPSPYLFLTLPSPFLLQANSRLKQIEKDFSQRLTKSAQVISFLFWPLPPLSFILDPSFSSEHLKGWDN